MKLTKLLPALILTACSDTELFHYGDVDLAVLISISERYEYHCGIPIVFITHELTHAPPIDERWSSTIRITSGSTAVTKIVLDTDTPDRYGVHFRSSGLISITWNEPDTLEKIISHELGHKFGLGHVEDINNTMYEYINTGNLEVEFTSDQWEVVCENYLTETAERIKRWKILMERER